MNTYNNDNRVHLPDRMAANAASIATKRPDSLIADLGFFIGSF